MILKTTIDGETVFLLQDVCVCDLRLRTRLNALVAKDLIWRRELYVHILLKMVYSSVTDPCYIIPDYFLTGLIFAPAEKKQCLH